MPVIQVLSGPNYYNGAAQQLAFSLAIQNTPVEKLRGRPLSDFGFRCFSQLDEDGILLYIFALIGHGSRLCLELGCGHGIESNTANLLIHHHWYGIIVDGDSHNIAVANRFYNSCQDTLTFQPLALNTFITRENVNALTQHATLAAEIDLLSIDIDGNDWWIWEAITAVKPRVVVIESPPHWGPEASVTIPYQADFVYDFSDEDYYYGTCTLALSRLAKRKGYRLIGCSKYGTNLFFLREDIGQDYFPEVTVESCYESFSIQQELKKRNPRVVDREWVYIREDGTAS